jgi:hypothetical protein
MSSAGTLKINKGGELFIFEQEKGGSMFEVIRKQHIRKIAAYKKIIAMK